MMTQILETQVSNDHNIGDINRAICSLIAQTESILRGIEIQHTMDLIHEYELDNLHTSYFDVDEQEYCNVELGKFRPILNKACYDDVVSFRCKIMEEIHHGFTNTPYVGGFQDDERVSIVYGNDNDSVISENIKKINSMMEDVSSSSENVGCVATRYDYINKRYITSINDAKNPYDKRCICYVATFEDDKIYLHDNDGSKIEMNSDSIDHVGGIMNDAIIERRIRMTGFADIEELIKEENRNV